MKKYDELIPMFYMLYNVTGGGGHIDLYGKLQK